MPISPESSYCLEGMMSCFDAPPDFYTSVGLSNLNIDNIFDNHQFEPVGNRPREYFYNLYDVINQKLMEWRENEATPFQRQFIAISSLFSSNYALHEFESEIASSIINHFLESRGIKQTDFLARTKNNLIDFKISNIRDMIDSKWVKLTIENDDHLLRYLSLLAEMYVRNITAIKTIEPNKFLLALQDLKYDILSRNTENIYWGDIDNAIMNGNASRQHHRKQDIRNAQKSLKKQVLALENIVGKGTYKAFVSKDGFRLEGKRFDYSIKKTHDLLSHTMNVSFLHIPYELYMLDKETGERLASGCIVFKDTPVLDQIIALALHVRDKESELELIKETNWSLLSRKGIDIDVLNQNIPYDVVRGPNLPTTIPFSFQVSKYSRYQQYILRLLRPYVQEALFEIIAIPRRTLSIMLRPPIVNDITDYANLYHLAN